MPRTDDEMPRTDDEMPQTDDEMPQTDDEMPRTDDEMPQTDDEKWLSNFSARPSREGLPSHELRAVGEWERKHCRVHGQRLPRVLEGIMASRLDTFWHV